VPEDRLRLIQGDITTIAADAIVNAANEHLLPGGGVCGAIHRVGGPQIARECAAIGYCRTGDAVMTSAGNLPARFVIHAVAPVWRGGSQDEAAYLASAYRRSLEVADGAGVATVAFPSLGTGIYGYPVDLAAPAALATVKSYLANTPSAIEDVTFVLFSEQDLRQYSRALAMLD
jgi:O-acetyl-ADP-ribose deacetylase (regulator of RNase III)